MDTNSEEIIIGDKEDGNLSYVIAKVLVKMSPLTSWQSLQITHTLAFLGKLEYRMLIPCVVYVSQSTREKMRQAQKIISQLVIDN